MIKATIPISSWDDELISRAFVPRSRETPVKSNTHPKLHPTIVSCACGNSFETLATKQNLRVEICSACHPFYTGKQRTVAREGQVEKFRQRYNLKD